MRNSALLMAGVLAVSLQNVLAGPEEDYQRGFKAYQQEDLIGAMMALEPAAQAGHVRAQVLLAYLLDKAEENERAVALYQKAADAGDGEALINLGVMYVQGEGVKPDAEKGRSYIEQAANAGYGPAIMLLGENYLSGGLGLTPDRAKAIDWLQKGVKMGYQPAQQRLEQLQKTGK